MAALFRKKERGADVPALRSAAAGAGAAYGAGSYGAAIPRVAPPSRFTYPLKGWLPLRGLGVMLMLLGAVNALRSLGAFISLLGNFTTYNILLLVSAVASLLFSVAVGALIVDLLPRCELRREGLAVSALARWPVVPWERIVRLHSLDLPGERYIVFVQYAGRPVAPGHLVYGLLAGLGAHPGIFYTSDISDFDDLTRAVLDARMRATPGLAVTDLLIDNAPMPVFEMAYDPLGTMDQIAALGPADAPPGATPPRPPVQTARATLVRQQLALAAVPVLLFWMDNLVSGGVPFLSDTGWSLLTGTVGLLVIGLLELPFVGLAVQALGENALGEGDLPRALTTYPYLEMPRLLAFVVILALLAIKAPFGLIFLLWLAAIAYTAYLTLLFTQRLYRIPQNRVWLAAGASALVQLVLLLAYTLLRFGGLVT